MTDDDLTGTTRVQNWMIRLAVWTIVVLGAGAVGTTVTAVNWLFILQHSHGDLKRDVAEIRVKHSDFIDMFNSQNATLHEHGRKLDVIDARLERAMP